MNQIYILNRKRLTKKTLELVHEHSIVNRANNRKISQMEEEKMKEEGNIFVAIYQNPARECVGEVMSKS